MTPLPLALATTPEQSSSSPSPVQQDRPERSRNGRSFLVVPKVSTCSPYTAARAQARHRAKRKAYIEQVRCLRRPRASSYSRTRRVPHATVFAVGADGHEAAVCPLALTRPGVRPSATDREDSRAGGREPATITTGRGSETAARGKEFTPSTSRHNASKCSASDLRRSWG